MHVTSAPAWSFRVKPEEKNNFLTPGPGNYNPSLSKYENSPNYKIGTSSRDANIISSTPGPGTYESKSTILGKPAPKIGSSQRLPLSETIETPGPGAYQIFDPAEGPKFSMQGRKDPGTFSLNPGPGHYNQGLNDVNSKDRAPTYRIGSGSRTERPSSAIVPGPGAYNADKKHSGPSWGFGTQSRVSVFKLDIPGPGTYTNTDSLTRRGFSMAGRRPQSSNNSYPGPGSYNPSTTDRPKSPGWSMGKSSRDKALANGSGIPGPGSYSSCNTLGKTAPVFGSSTRQGLSSVSQTPGPGEYNAYYKNHGPSYSMRPKTASSNKNSGPGPGQYNPSASCGDFKWTMGKEPKGLNLSLSKTTSVPGPGYYNCNKGPGGPKWGFGSEPKSKIFKDPNPGPGSYATYSTIGNLPGYARRP